VLEFWVDPENPYHKPVCPRQDLHYQLCFGLAFASGDRGLQAIDLKPVKNLTGGFTGWKEAGGTAEELPAKKGT
jgi:hypothetical protein